MMRGGGESWLLLVLGLSLIAFSHQQNFDYFSLVQQYPPAVCNNRVPPCPRPAPPRFTIHGLFPKFNNNTPLVYCPGPAFDINQIRSIVGQLNLAWPNFQDGNSNENFWQHAWAKHGRCWEPNNQRKYFQKALDLQKKNNLLRILQNNGLGPDLRTTRELQQIRSVLQRGIQGRVEPALRCINSSGRTQLAEIVLCYRNNAVTPMNCPARLTNCPARFIWLPSNSSMSVPIDSHVLPNHQHDFDMDEDLTEQHLLNDE